MSYQFARIDLSKTDYKESVEWKYLLELPKTRAWQCLNGRMCPHRSQVVEVLKSWPQGTLSYGDHIPLENWAYSTYRGCENDNNFLRLANLYGSTRVNIVTETIYDYTPGIISEKTLLAFVAQQIPIVIGHQGIVQHCRELGFDMFDDIIDHGYDSIEDEDQRMNSVVQQCVLLDQRFTLDRCVELKTMLAERLDNNYNLLKQIATHRDDKFRDLLKELNEN